MDQFLRDKAHRWVGPAGEGEYAEVDRWREIKGDVSLSGTVGLEREIAGVVGGELGGPEGVAEGEGAFERFGRAFGSKWWNFEEGWINLNHGQSLCNMIVSSASHFADLGDGYRLIRCRPQARR